MRDHVLFYVNGRRTIVRGETAFCSLSDFLRGHLHLTGTKVVCAEGDCGACTVLVGTPDNDRLRFEAVDACILFLYQLDGKHVVTVEGLKDEGRLHPVQGWMIACHGSQCGYCTPGFVMALAGLREQEPRKGTMTEPEFLRLGLTGNLCRCTGYVPILEAGLNSGSSLALQYSSLEMLAELRQCAEKAVLLQTDHRTFFLPRRLEEALDFKARHPEAVIVSGNTELGVLRNKKDFDPPILLSLAGIPELSELKHAKDAVIGANVTWTRIEHFARKNMPEFYRIIIRFGSPQIRNVSTLAGNVANGSPIADSLPFLFVMGAEVELARSGGTRRVPIRQFYLGYKRKDLAPDEIIVRIHVPLPGANDRLRLYKVSRRHDLDIATFGAAIRVICDGDTIRQAHLAYSGVAPTVVTMSETEAFLLGRRFTEETFAEAGQVARKEIEPITDVRGSRDYRLQLAENILQKFYFDCKEGTAAAGGNGRDGGRAP